MAISLPDYHAILAQFGGVKSDAFRNAYSDAIADWQNRNRQRFEEVTAFDAASQGTPIIRHAATRPRSARRAVCEGVRSRHIKPNGRRVARSFLAIDTWVFRFFWRPLTLVLVTGAVLTPGKRTVSAVLRIMGLGQATDFALYHHVLSQARWDSWAIARKLLTMILERFLPAAPVIVGIDDIIERRWGEKTFPAGHLIAGEGSQGHGAPAPRPPQ